MARIGVWSLVLIAVCVAASNSEASGGRPPVVAASIAVEAGVRTRTSIGGDPLEVLRRADRDLWQVIARRVPDWSPEAPLQRSSIVEQLGRLFDYTEIARQTLAGTWSHLAASQQDAFVKTFSALTNHRFMTTWGDLVRTGRIDYESETISGSEARVRAAVRPSNPEVGTSEPPVAGRRIEYRLHRDERSWLVDDVIVDGASLVATTRDELSSLLRRESFDALLKTMNRRLLDEERPDQDG